MTTSGQAVSPASRASLRRAGVITALGLACAAQFVLQLDFSIVNIALPTIQRELGFAPAELQWIVTGYALTFGSLLLLGGRLGDLLGRRRLLELGLGAFGIASLVCGLSLSPAMLIGARLAQGAAAALVSPSALALLAAANPEGPARNRAMSLFQAATAAGATAGVVAGGILVQFVGWRSIFLVNVPIVVVLVLLIRRVIPRDSTFGRPKLDVAGAVLVTASGAALIYGLSRGQESGFASLPTLAALVAAGALAVLFVAVERRVSSPMLPFAYFRPATHRASVGATALVGVVIVSYVYFVSLYLQRVLGFSPLLTGIAVIPSTATVVAVSTLLTRRAIGRLGVKWTLLLGLGLIAAGQLWFAQLSASGSYLANVFPGQVLTAGGIALALPAAAIGATSGVASSEQGLATGLLNTAQQMGAAVGLAVLASVAAAWTARTSSLSAGYALAYLLATGIALVAVIAVAARLNHAACQEELARRRAVEGGGS